MDASGGPMAPGGARRGPIELSGRRQAGWAMPAIVWPIDRLKTEMTFDLSAVATHRT
jgi:hypothetical protein